MCAYSFHQGFLLGDGRSASLRDGLNGERHATELSGSGEDVRKNHKQGAGLALLLGQGVPKQSPSWQLWTYPQWWTCVLPATEPTPTPDSHDGPIRDSHPGCQLPAVGTLPMLACWHILCWRLPRAKGSGYVHGLRCCLPHPGRTLEP